jgi:asparagine synthase (glutamine-hydrolysing)
MTEVPAPPRDFSPAEGAPKVCGIVGYLNLDRAQPADSARITAMCATIVHRGPDDQGVMTDGPVGLGMRRLAIIDVASGRQPIANEDETIHIVFNGEIYNHLGLRDRLLAAGHVFRTLSDTETILHLYEEEGDDCVHQLRGMFAFAIWDAPRNRLLVARDRLGIKPLFYALDEGRLAFASEMKAILALPEIPGT